MRGESWVWKWDWRREPRGRELGELEELGRVLGGIVLQKGKGDSPLWRLDPISWFSVKTLRALLVESRELEGDSSVITIWD